MLVRLDASERKGFADRQSAAAAAIARTADAVSDSRIAHTQHNLMHAVCRYNCTHTTMLHGKLDASISTGSGSAMLHSGNGIVIGSSPPLFPGGSGGLVTQNEEVGLMVGAVPVPVCGTVPLSLRPNLPYKVRW